MVQHPILASCSFHCDLSTERAELEQKGLVENLHLAPRERAGSYTSLWPLSRSLALQHQGVFDNFLHESLNIVESKI